MQPDLESDPGGPEDEAPEAQDGIPSDDSGADIEIGRKLFAAECRFLLSVADMDQLPGSALPEVAFAGRSNVGKSSLVNALTGRKTLARTSNTPGRTQQLNFFSQADRLMLVDLPGYGYAQATRSDVKRWTALTRAYLKGRPQLRRVLLLVDARHGLKDTDREVMKELDGAAVVYQVALTKADKIKPSELERLIADTAAELATHVAAHPQVAPTSSVKGTGVPELRASLGELALPEPLR